MGKYASEVIAQAKAWIGLNENDGSFKRIIDTYNSHKPLAVGYTVKYTDEWCATFVSAVAIELGYTDVIPTECGCERMIELFKKLGAWEENDAHVPKAGDVIFYDWGDSGKGDNKGYADHVGYVENVTGGKITVIEGNYSRSVKRRVLDVNAKYIRGYGVPKYDTEATIERKYYVLVGEYNSLFDATNVVSKLKAAGFNATIKTEDGKVVEEEAKAVVFKKGDVVRMQMNAPVYGKAGGFAPWVYNSVLFVRDVAGDRVVISTKVTGAITGAVDKKYLTKA